MPYLHTLCEVNAYRDVMSCLHASIPKPFNEFQLNLVLWACSFISSSFKLKILREQYKFIELLVISFFQLLI
jgi:hypothetical protein